MEVLQHPGHFFQNNVLCGARDAARYQFSLTPCEAGSHPCSRKKTSLFYFAISTGSVPFISPSPLPHEVNVKLANFIVSIPTAV